MSKIKSYESLCWYCEKSTNCYKCSISLGLVPKGVTLSGNGFVVKCPYIKQDVPFVMSDGEFKNLYKFTKSSCLSFFNRNLNIDTLRAFKVLAIEILKSQSILPSLPLSEYKAMKLQIKNKKNVFSRLYNKLLKAIAYKRLYYECFLPFKYHKLLCVDEERIVNKIYFSVFPIKGVNKNETR